MKALYEKSSSECVENERGPPFQLRKYSVAQQCMICSSLPERISLLQANNQQQGIRVNVPKSKAMWQIPQPRQSEADSSFSKKEWAEKEQHNGQLHVHSPCPHEARPRIQHLGQQPDHSSFALRNTATQSWPDTTTASRHCPVYAAGTWKQPQDVEPSGEPATDLHSYCRDSDSSVKESGGWVDKPHPGSRKASFLSRLLSEKAQLQSDLGSSGSQNSSCLNFSHRENSSSPVLSITGHKTSMVSKEDQPY